jgi:hypothetical protein
LPFQNVSRRPFFRRAVNVSRRVTTTHTPHGEWAKSGVNSNARTAGCAARASRISSQYAVVKEPFPAQAGGRCTQVHRPSACDTRSCLGGRMLVDRRGVEPLTLALQRRRSTTELPAQYSDQSRPDATASCKGGWPASSRPVGGGWCAGADSNRRPHAYQACALTN